MKIYFLRFLIISLLIFAGHSCSKKKGINKRQLLNKYKAEHKQLEEKISALETELNTTRIEVQKKTYPVSTVNVSKSSFSNYIKIPGVITSKQNVQLFAEIPGNIITIYVKKGQNVYKGQLIAKQDASSLTSQLNQLRTNLKLATTTFERQERLWKQNIGSEMQYLQAKTNKETLQDQIYALNTQIDKYSIKSPISGTVDEIYINQGEMAASLPIARVVNLRKVQIEAQISEKYIGRVNKYDKVSVIIPNMGLDIKTKISSVGNIVNPISRTFRIEAEFLNPQKKLKPNMSASLKVRINKIDNIITIPFSIIQKDGDKSYVFIVKGEDGNEISVKKYLDIKDVYQGTAAIKSGLSENDALITQGYTKLQDGFKVLKTN